MPALTISSPTNNGTSPSSPAAQTPTTAPTAYDYEYPDYSRSASPPRPPVSPITPVATIAQLAPTDPAEHVVLPPQASTFMRQPASVPISESENPDAIAMRSAISLLQMQREKSKRDIQTLERLKKAAVAEPEAFVREMRAGRLQSANSTSNILIPTLAESMVDSVEDQTMDGNEAPNEQERKDPAGATTPPDSSTSKFPPIPTPQNIFRCPPVNWAKYHIVGESLDKLHEEQKQRPSLGEPLRGDQSSGRAPVHVIAAPYSPFTDRLGELHPMQTRRGSKKPAP
ncbi:hypothetical protein K432DRAFT_377973 [Lepidopterella palustris CBS 459.81]|uniref:Uncharacterized protein n=1 Tax=Lepidopterella palustris CBS 459.81 TaxID=1314670 RepID=A0A8E2EJV3_9PEZI|nr:hypothetical protein K432DRAFT_377973 [Lepidopterella palustris CBS 459.81]